MDPFDNAHLYSDRRRGKRYDTSLRISVKLLPDGAPFEASCVEISPNGMRIVTPIPIGETTYISITFKSASNNTQCEGRIVWTKRLEKNSQYESGVDIQRWESDTPSDNILENIPFLTLKKDRRKTPRKRNP